MRMFWLMFVILATLIPVEGKTRNDFDPDADFSTFKTFSLVAGIDLAKSGLLDDPERRMRVANFVSGVLERRGLREVPQDQEHDLAVRVWVAVRDRQSVTTTPYSATYFGGYDPFFTGVWGYVYEETVVRNYLEGTLIIDLLNPANKQLVWRTYLKRDYSDRAKAYDQLRNEIDKAFAKYPPSVKEQEKQRQERKKWFGGRR